MDFGTVAVGTSVTRTFQIANTGNLVLTLTKAAPPAGVFTTSTPAAEGQQLNPGDTLSQTVTFSPTTAGPSTGTYLITGNDGQGAQQVTLTGVGGGPPAGTIAPPSAGGWSRNGAATQSAGDTVLTPAATGRAGDVVYPSALSPDGLHVTFTAQIGPGTGVDGMTFALLDASKTTKTSIGRSGGSLGFGSLSGVAVALDTYKGSLDPSNNFVGIATGATGTAFSLMTWAATAPVPTKLTTGTHTVDVMVAGSTITAVVDGGAPLVASVTLPPKVLLAFTAGTGGLMDQHVVRDVKITSPSVPVAAPVGPIVGIAGKCVDVAGGSKVDGTAVQLYPCNASAAQKWTLAPDHTLRALGSCLDIPGGLTTAGTKTDLSACTGASGQVWLAQPDRTLVNPTSGLCLSAPGTTGASYTKLTIAGCSAAPGQLWTLPS